MPRRPDLPLETLEERWQLEAQTARNLEAFEAERGGRLDDAIALYEQNVAESFPGDLPYGRLVAIYERAADLDAAERVLRRAIAVFDSTTRRTPQDRRATLRVFQKRLKLLEQRRRRVKPAHPGPVEAPGPVEGPAPKPTRKRRSSVAPSE